MESPFGVAPPLPGQLSGGLPPMLALPPNIGAPPVPGAPPTSNQPPPTLPPPTSGTPPSGSDNTRGGGLTRILGPAFAGVVAGLPLFLMAGPIAGLLGAAAGAGATWFLISKKMRD